MPIEWLLCFSLTLVPLIILVFDHAISKEHNSMIAFSFDPHPTSSFKSMLNEDMESREYITGKGSSGLTRGAEGMVLASGFALFPVALPPLSFFTFLTEAPCFPPSMDLF